MIAKHLQRLIDYLLDLAGVPTQIAEARLADDDATPPGSEPEGSLQPVRVKSFLHYL
ncbi:MAG: hypothetical protein VKK43_02405 [Synechococcaceae cyanobacterium]|nr:hypothetical protein [Synechococcaceae cyanobacterium]